MKITCLLAVSLVTGLYAMAYANEANLADVAIIPQPLEVVTQPGSFTIQPDTPILAEGPAVAEAVKLQDALAPAMGFRLSLGKVGQSPKGAITLQLDDSLQSLGEEGHTLIVDPSLIALRAHKPDGLFRGIQSILQLLPPAIFRKAAVDGIPWQLPCVKITDQPRFQWRGLMLDTSRHFMPKTAVLKFIDTMALHKFNSLQIHLTDDQGWRIEIKKYPRLTEVGGWRDETLLGHARKEPLTYDGRRHGGFYTQDDIREIVRYAADRHINVVPEIEMPGHARAAISAYPQLGCNPSQTLKPWTRWGVCPDIFNPGDGTIQFLHDVLTEVLELFPSKFIHIGGDEAVKDQWKASPAVQARIKELGLKNEDEMQAWFIKQMDHFLTDRGRRLVGWDEILEGGLAPGATVMSWRGEKGGIAAAKAGHDVIMAPTTYTYLDYYQGPEKTEPLAIGGNLPLAKVYSYEPIPKELTEQEAVHVLGGQAQLWAEYIPTPRHLEYMAYPRATAMAEVLWSPKKLRDEQQFMARLRTHLKRLAAMDINYRPLENKE